MATTDDIQFLRDQAREMLKQNNPTAARNFMDRAYALEDGKSNETFLQRAPVEDPALTQFVRAYTPGGDFTTAGASYLANKVVHPLQTISAITNAVTGQSQQKDDLTSYNNELQTLRGKSDLYTETDPMKARLSYLAGSVTNPLNNWIMGKIGGAIPAKTVSGVVGRTAAQGGATGTIEGAQSSRGADNGIPGPWDFARDTLTGTALGTAGGLAFPGAPLLINKGYDVAKSGIANLLSRATLPASQMARRGEIALGRDFAKDLPPDYSRAMLVQKARQRVAEMGPDTVLADVGPNTRGEAEAAANQLGDTLTAAEGLAERHLEQGPTILAKAESIAGGNKDQLIARRRAEAAPLYEAADMNQPISTPRLNRILSSPEARDGLQAGKDAIRREADNANVPYDPNAYAMNTDMAGNLHIDAQTPLRTVDAVRRGWSEMLHNEGNAAIYNQDTGTLTPYGRDITEKLKILTNETESQLPQAYPGVTPGTTQSAWGYANRRWGELSQPIVAMNTLKNTIDRAYDTSDLTNRVYGSPSRREKLAGLGTPQQMAEFKVFMDNTGEKARTYHNVSANSRTAFRTAAQAEQNAPVPVDFISNPIKATWQAAANLFTRPPASVAAAEGVPLVTSDPAVREAYLKSIANRRSGQDVLDDWKARLRFGGAPYFKPVPQWNVPTTPAPLPPITLPPRRP
jgi:hypothetical protein